MIKQFFNDLKAKARQLKEKFGIEYDKCAIEVLLNGYCEACDTNNAQNKNLFMSGLLLRCWYLATKLRQKSPGYGKDLEEFVMWVYEGIEYACKYRAWQNPEKKVNGMQAINRCVETIRLQHHYESNLDKHKANYNTMSLEDPIEGSDNKATFLDLLESEEYADPMYEGNAQDAARELIQVYVSQNKLVEAVIFDVIAFNDVEHEVKKTVDVILEDGTVKKTTTKYKEFWPFRCVQLLHQLPNDYAQYFVDNYKVRQKDIDAVLDVFDNANNQKLYRYLRKTLANAQTVLAGHLN